MDVVLIGAGRLATHLGMALKQAGHRIQCVYSRTMASASALAAQTGGVAVDDVQQVPQTADVFVMAVKDAVLATLAAQLAKGREGQVFLHTAGSMPMDLFQGLVRHYGVFYPIQTFSKERQVDFSEIPVFIEGCDDEALHRARTLAESVSRRVFLMSSDERKYLHLAAVFACNFTNHCYALASDILHEHGLPFDVMLPLIDETTRKVHDFEPKDVQTGPAVRYDENVISMQTALLADHPLAQDIYERMSQSIHQKTIEQQ